MALSGNTRFQLWQCLSKADKLWTAKCPNYCHLGFRPQSLNKFWKGPEEPIYVQSEGRTIGSPILFILLPCKHLTSDSDSRFGWSGKETNNNLYSLTKLNSLFESTWLILLYRLQWTEVGRAENNTHVVLLRQSANKWVPLFSADQMWGTTNVHQDKNQLQCVVVYFNHCMVCEIL